MHFGAASIGLGFLAGALSILSPCVLPVLPLLLAPAAAAHRFGVAALAAGLVLAFVAAGLLVGTAGFALGLDSEVLRDAAAVVLAALGVVLLSGALQRRFSRLASGLSEAGNRGLARISGGGLAGQFVLGLLLGLAWSPCVGPTLGAASLLAAQGREIGLVAAVMAAFGLGMLAPLLALGMLSRQVLLRWRGRLVGAGQGGRLVLGGSALVVATLILTGADRWAETALTASTPAWLTDLTTRF
jgi:cytochrome c biogenesis protein CcdA